LEFNELFVRDKSDIDDDLFSSLLDRLSLVRLFREKIVKKISSILPIWKQARGIYDLVL
jgi:hypothetical protein